jgi:hypothetical protein
MPGGSSLPIVSVSHILFLLKNLSPPYTNVES